MKYYLFLSGEDSLYTKLDMYLKDMLTKQYEMITPCISGMLWHNLEMGARNTPDLAINIDDAMEEVKRYQQ